MVATHVFSYLQISISVGNIYEISKDQSVSGVTLESVGDVPCFEHGLVPHFPHVSSSLTS